MSAFTWNALILLALRKCLIRPPPLPHEIFIPLSREHRSLRGSHSATAARYLFDDTRNPLTFAILLEYRSVSQEEYFVEFPRPN